MSLESAPILSTSNHEQDDTPIEDPSLESYLARTTETPLEDILEYKVEYLNDGLELITNFENSTEYKEAYDTRLHYLKMERPEIDYNDQELLNDISEDFRGLPEYNMALHRYYFKHRLNFDDLTEEAQNAVFSYWKFIQFTKRQLDLCRGDEQAYKDTAARFDRERDKYHIVASNALLNDISHSSNPNYQYQTDHNLAGWLNAGRQLVSLLTEEKGLDKADPYREIKKAMNRKNNAILDSLGI